MMRDMEMLGTRMRQVLLVAMFALGLAGCGGGGGGDSFSLTMPQVPLKASFFSDQISTELIAEATASGSISAPVIYVLLFDELNIFAPGEVWFSTIDGERYEVRLKLSPNVNVGVHKGTLQVRVCPDAACKSVLASASRPYEITIKPPTIESIPDPLQLTALRGDAVQIYLKLKNARQGMPIYVSARGAGGAFSGQATRLEPLLHTFGEYYAKLPLASGIAAQGFAGELRLDFCADPACAVPYLSRVLPYQVQVLAQLEGIGLVGGMALDGDQNLYLGAGEKILKVTPEGAISTVFDRTTASGNPQPPSASAVALDANGNVYFSSFLSSTYKVTSSSAASYAVSASAADMSFDSAGNLYIATASYDRRVLKFTPEGEFVEGWAPLLELQEPSGIVVDDAGVVYIAEARGVVRLEPDGSSRFIGTIPSSQPWGERAWDLALGSSGSVLVTTLGGVFRVTESGVTETIIAPRSPLASRGGARFYPSYIVQTPEGRVYLADGANEMVVYTQVP